MQDYRIIINVCDTQPDCVVTADSVSIFNSKFDKYGLNQDARSNYIQLNSPELEIVHSICH